jgi:tetratricopeptide (TPR) repeat protein
MLLAGFAYFTTLCPTVYVGDSGELAAASYFLGVPHSPGYPLYCLVGWLFTHAPIGTDIAFRLNIMSAVFACLTVLVLYLIIYHFTRTPYLSFSISLAYAFSPIFWSQAVVAEVYSLNTFLTALSLYFLCRWVEKRRDKWLYWAVGTMGLATANHQLSVLLLPTALYMLWLFGKGFKKPVSFWMILAGLYLLGAMVYLYLPIRASVDPPVNWGDPDTFGKFFSAVFNPASRQVAHGSRWVHFLYALYLWIIQFSPVVPIGENVIPLPIIWLFGIWGIYKGLSTGWRMARIFVFFMLLNLAAILYVSRPSKEELMIVGVYYLPVFLVFAVFMATGIREWLQRIQELFKQSGKAFLSVILVLVIIILVLIPEYQYYQNRDEADRHDDFYARDYATALLNSCPNDTILIVNWDDIFTIWYLQKVEGLRTDVIPVFADFPIGSSAYFWGSWYFDELGREYPEIFEGARLGDDGIMTREDAIDAFVTANLARGRQVYFSFYGLGYDFKRFSFKVFPIGPVYRSGDSPYNLPDLIVAQQAWTNTIANFRNIYSYREHRIIEEDFIISRLSNNLWNTAQVASNLVRELHLGGDKVEWFLLEAIKIDPGNIPATIGLVRLYTEENRYEQSLDLLMSAREVDPYNPDIYMYLARLYELMGDREAAIKSAERVLELDPGHPDAMSFLKQYR